MSRSRIITNITRLFQTVKTNIARHYQAIKTSNIIRFELGLIMALLLAIVVVEIPKDEINRDYRDGLVEKENIPVQVNEYRKTLIQIIGGVVVFVGLWLTWRRIVATEDTVKVAQKGQITERFTRAIEQFGNKEVTIRLGGIYALEHIAKDSEEYHWTVMEVLSSFVREKAPLPEQASTYEEAPDDADELEPSAGIPTDIQAIFTVIGRRKAEREGEDQRLDLKRTWLQGANLQGVNLEGANLRGVVLRKANLFRAFLKESNLQDGDLQGANLRDAYLEGASLQGTSLAFEKPIFKEPTSRMPTLKEPTFGKRI